MRYGCLLQTKVVQVFVRLTSATSTSAQLKLCIFPFDSSIAMFPEAYATSTPTCARELQPQLRAGR